MSPLRDLVRDRLKVLGLRQLDLAVRLGMDPSYLSKLLGGPLPPEQLERAPDWVRALEVTGQIESDLLDALHLAVASERVRALVDRLQAEINATVPALARYRDRVAEVLYILTFVEPAPGGGGQPPPPITDPAELLRVLAELIQERNRLMHGMPRLADAPNRPEPSAS